MRITGLKCEHMPAQINKINNALYCTDNKEPHFSFYVEGAESNKEVKYYKLIVSSSAELADDGVGDMYDSGIIYSSVTNDIVYKGKPLLPCSVYYFKIYAMIGDKALKSGVGAFATGIGDVNKLRGAFITAADGVLIKSEETEGKGDLPAPYFRKDINAEKEISYVYAYITSLGVYELYVNGVNVNRAKFAPGFTDYHKTLQYNFYDVSKYFRYGENTVGAIVGDGWYKSSLSITGRNNYGDKCAFSAYFCIVYTDGSFDEVYTDESWECFSGAFIYTDNQNGEYFDSRLDKKDVFEPERNKEETPHAVKFSSQFLRETDMISAIGPDVTEMMRIKPVSVSEVNGKYIADFGQNIVGVSSVKLKCKAGTKVVFRHGEMLKPDIHLPAHIL